MPVNFTVRPGTRRPWSRKYISPSPSTASSRSCCSVALAFWASKRRASSLTPGAAVEPKRARMPVMSPVVWRPGGGRGRGADSVRAPRPPDAGRGRRRADKVRGRPRRQHPRHDPPRITADHHQDRRTSDLPGPQRDLREREPQIALDQLARLIARPRDRIRRLMERSQLPNPPLEHRMRPGPAGPLPDHCRGRVRELLQRLTVLRLERVHDRALRDPLILGHGVTRRSPANRVQREHERPPAAALPQERQLVRQHPRPPRHSRCRTQQPPTQDARLGNPSRASV